MAFRLSGESVRMIEHEILDDMDYWGVENKDAEKMLAYISGVHNMANAVIKAIQELGGR